MRRIAYLLAAVLLVIQTASEAEILMSTREGITFAENLTLVVMDVEPGAGAGTGVVWLELRDDRGPLKSSILRAGESFSYTGRGDGLNLTVTRIYAGGEKDLVELEIVSGVVVVRAAGDLGTEPAQDDGRPAGEGDSSLLNRVLAALLALLLAFWVYFGARGRGR